MTAGAIGSFGLGVAAFYLNFLYRALGLDDGAIGVLAAALALGALVGAAPAALMARRLSRRAAILIGGTITAAGIIGILAFDTVAPLFVSAALLGCGGIVVSSSGSALIADATVGGGRAAMFGRQIAFGTASAFLATFAAGALAAPLGEALGIAPRDAVVVRSLIGAGGLIAALSVLPILFVRAPRVPRGGHDAPVRRRLLVRFLAVEACIGFGAGSFLPFLNLFFTDRFGLDFLAVGTVLGLIAVGGSLGALLHSRVLVPRLGMLRAVVAVELASLPFALLAAFAPTAPVATAALAMRALLMFGGSATYTAFSQASFAPAERAGAYAAFQIAWSGASAVGAVISGRVRAAAGPDGFTVNIAMLVAAYVVAALLQYVLFRHHEPAGDALATAPHSAP